MDWGATAVTGWVQLPSLTLNEENRFPMFWTDITAVEGLLSGAMELQSVCGVLQSRANTTCTNIQHSLIDSIAVETALIPTLCITVGGSNVGQVIIAFSTW